MVDKSYRLQPDKSTYKPVGSPPLSERFLAHAQRVRSEGRDDHYYLKCADIAKRLETNQPVGHYRRKNKRQNRKPWPLGENLRAVHAVERRAA